MTLITIEEATFNPDAIDYLAGSRSDYCEVYFRCGKYVSFNMSQVQFAEKVLMLLHGKI
jgi:hypothetical protein